MVRIKICGVCSPKIALAAADAGADAIGLVFAPSRRRVDPDTARTICAALPPFITKVGVFVNAPEHEVDHLVQHVGLDAVQFHGDESPGYCAKFQSAKVIKALGIENPASLQLLKQYPVDAFLLDSSAGGQSGGSGCVFPWEWLKQTLFNRPVILAGGLNEDNILTALQTVHPFAVDISSGVETAGQKDPAKIVSLINKIRRWEYANHEE